MEKIIKIISLVKHNFIKHQAFTLFSVLILSALFLLTNLPYFSLFLSVDNIIIIYWIIVVLLFWPSAETSFVLGIIFLLLACFFQILGQNSIAEQAGNIIYFLIAIGFLQRLVIYFKKRSL
jgi:signal transduction histidine kinase